MEILKRKRRRKRKSQNRMMLSNQLSEAGDDTKRSKMRRNMKRIRKTKADHRIEKEWQALGRKKIFCPLSSLLETPKENHQRRKRKLRRTAKTSALNSSKIFR